MTVAEAHTRISSQEFTHWKAFHRFNPIGGVRGDLQAAQVSFVVASANSGKGNRPKFKDFILNFRGRVRPTVEELTAKLMGWVGSYNADN